LTTLGQRDEPQEEGNDAARCMLIEDGMQIVDSSRVNVDTAALSRWAENRYRESYSRYKALVDAGIGVAEDFEVVYQRLLRSSNPQGEFFSVPENEADTFLVKMVLGIKNEFLSNPKHGLAFYLGKRIRHGTLTGHLRGSVENTDLITQRTSETGPYKTNEYWLNKLHFHDVTVRRRVDDAFMHFASKYDEIIHDLKDVRLHVLSKQHPKGVFDINVTARAYHWIRSVYTNRSELRRFLKSLLYNLLGVIGTVSQRGSARAQATDANESVRAAEVKRKCWAIGHKRL
jgi:hypothetical protein